MKMGGSKLVVNDRNNLNSLKGEKRKDDAK